MTLRLRIFALVSSLVALTVLLVTWTVSSRARTAFESVDAERRAALVAQFRREFAREGEEVVRRLDRVASSDAAIRLALDSVSSRNHASHVNDAAPMASAAGLDFLDAVSADGTIVSSAQWPARFGYQHGWTARAPLDARGAFLAAVELPNGAALGLMAVRPVNTGDPPRVYLAGGRRLDQQFLQSLVLPAGMRALLYRNLDPEVSGRQLVDASGPIEQASDLEPLIARVRQSGADASDTIARPGGSEAFEAMPLKGPDGRVLGVLLVAARIAN